MSAGWHPWLSALADQKKHYLKMASLEALRDGPLRGTTDWSYRALVLDIPEETHSLYYAFMLSRTGEGRFFGA